MASFTLTESEEFEAIPEGELLEAEIVNCELRETPFLIDENDPSKGKKEQVSFRFRIVEDGPYFGRTLFGNTPTTFTTHPDCKLRVWVQEILGMDSLPIDFEFDTETLIGATVKVIVGNRFKTAADGSQVAKDYVDTVARSGDMVFADEAF